jgi:hypothetical protein
MRAMCNELRAHPRLMGILAQQQGHELAACAGLAKIEVSDTSRRRGGASQWPQAKIDFPTTTVRPDP